MNAIPSICPASIDCFRPDGTLFDLARPMVEEIDFVAMAGVLSRIARFNGTPNCIAFSVAQHSVMGAEALLNEGHDEVTAALFLLHDGHEFLIGDKTRPFQQLLIETLAHRVGRTASTALANIFHDVKARWDDAIYAAAGLPLPGVWTNRQKSAVSIMDERMMLAESQALFGAEAVKNISRSLAAHKANPPKLKGAIKPWGAMKAEDAFLNLFIRLRGEERLQDQRMLHAAHAATFIKKSRG